MKTCVLLWKHVAEFLLEGEMLHPKVNRENRNTYNIFNNPFSENRSVCEIMSGVGWWSRTGLRRWNTKATKTHSKLLILPAFALQQWLRHRASMLRLYLHFLSCQLHLRPWKHSTVLRIQTIAGIEPLITLTAGNAITSMV